MDLQIDLRVMELLASRLFHDLVGPIGAVNNGMELVEEAGIDGMEDALLLAATSARQAARTLQFYRLAYGMAGGRLGSGLEKLRDLAAAFLIATKATLEWSVPQLDETASRRLGKLILNMIALGHEILPRGGALTVAVLNGAEETRASVTVSGTGAKLREETEQALAGQVAVADLTPRNVQGYFTRLLALRLGSDLMVETPSPESVRFSVTLQN